MHIPRIITIAALALMPAIAAAQEPAADQASTGSGAQTIKPATPAPGQAPATAPQDATSEFVPMMKNRLDFGVRGTSITGDSARYERYRDLGDGAFLQGFRLSREQNGWLFEAGGNDVGRRDQRLDGIVSKPGRFKLWGLWDQIPMLLSRTTRTLFVEDPTSSPSVLTIPDALQAQVQTSTAALPGLFAANATVFDTKSHRYIGQGGFDYLATQDLTLRTRLQVTDRQGTLPYGGSFGHSSLVEYPAPIKHRLTDFDTSAEFARDPVLLRAGFAGSWFHNDITQVTFDNPFRATDITGTPSRGRASLAPSNSLLSVNGMASVKLPRKSRATAYVSMGSLKDAGDPLMAQTINTVNLPLVTPLARTTVDGEARTSAVNLSFVSHPVKLFDVDARYRFYDYDNRTPEFSPGQRVAYDNTPAAATFSTLGGATSPLAVETEPFGVKRQTFDATLRFRPTSIGAAGAGYSRVQEDRTHRAIDSTTENTLRLTFDAVGSGLFAVRTKYEHGQKRGDITEEAKLELFNIGEQPGLRHFDIASRDRDRVTVLASVTPTSFLSLNGSVAAGKDDYLESTFGLRDNTHRILGAGADVTAGDNVSFGGSYSFERYNALLHSRQANPPSGTGVISYTTFTQLVTQSSTGVQVADASRDWANEGADRVHSVVASAEIANIGGKVDLRISYDYNRARALYTYTTGANIARTFPEEVPLPDSTLPNPTQLPLIRSELQRGTVDAIYSFTKRFGIGVSYWYEQYKVSDFTLDVDANPDLARGQALLLGYMYRPYTANTVWGRIIYRW